MLMAFRDLSRMWNNLWRCAFADDSLELDNSVVPLFDEISTQRGRHDFFHNPIHTSQSVFHEYVSDAFIIYEA
jgi:hypothetical protein